MRMRGVQLTLPLILPERGRSSCSSGGTPCGFCCAACLSVVAWCLRVRLALYSDSNENCLTSLFTIHTKHLSVLVARQRTTTKSIVTVQNLWPHLCCHGLPDPPVRLQEPSPTAGAVRRCLALALQAAPLTGSVSRPHVVLRVECCGLQFLQGFHSRPQSHPQQAWPRVSCSAMSRLPGAQGQLPSMAPSFPDRGCGIVEIWPNITARIDIWVYATDQTSHVRLGRSSHRDCT